jgi:hypothetical protein
LCSKKKQYKYTEARQESTGRQQTFDANQNKTKKDAQRAKQNINWMNVNA